MASVKHLCGATARPSEDPSQNRHNFVESFGLMCARWPPVPNDLRLWTTSTARSLEALSEDARIPNNRLAERVGVAPSTALQRVRALRGPRRRARLPRRGRPRRPGPPAAGDGRRPPRRPHARADRHVHQRGARPARRAVGLPPAGATDYLVWLAAADAQDLREFVVDHLATHPAVAHAETSLIYEHRRGPGIWGAAEPERRLTARTPVHEAGAPCRSCRPSWPSARPPHRAALIVVPAALLGFLTGAMLGVVGSRHRTIAERGRRARRRGRRLRARGRRVGCPGAGRSAA